MIFRYSSLADAHSCLRKYKLKHIDKSVEESESLDLSFGTAIHFAIKTHYEGGDALATFQMYWNSFKDKKISQGRYTWFQLKELGEKFINRFVEKYSSKFQPIEFERMLQMPLADHTYQGTLDMLCKYQGKTTLVDWKTSGSPYTLKKILTNEQMYGYAALAEYELKIKIDQLFYFVFVKSTGNIQTNIIVELDRARLEEMIENIKSMIRDLSTRTEWPRNPGCSFCVCGFNKG